MAEINTLARPYAKAAFDYADEHGSLDQWSRQLGLLAAVVRAPKVAAVLGSASLPRAQQAQCLIDVCGDEIDAPVQNFARLLAENRRLELLPDIHQRFEQHKSVREQRVDVDVVTAYELDADLADRLATALSRKLQREVAISTRVDRGLLGGVVVRAGDIVIDGSVRGRLGKLAEVMNLQD